MEPKINGLKPVWDEQIKTPKHDEMCLYLLNKSNLLKIFEKTLFINNQISSIQKLREKYYQEEFNNILIKNNAIFTKEKVEVNSDSSSIYKFITTGSWIVDKQYKKLNKIEWEIDTEVILEKPVKSKNFLIGVIDAEIIIYGLMKKYYTFTTEKLLSNNKISYESFYQSGEVYNKQPNESDMRKISNTNFTANIEKIELMRIYFEVKPKIESIGETLRQLNTYHSYLGGIQSEGYKINKENFILFTSKKETKEIFESQKYSFISLEELEPQAKQISLGDY